MAEFELNQIDRIDQEIRIRWVDGLDGLITNLALAGWADPCPRNLPFWLERSDALRQLSHLQDKDILLCCQIASWMNGASLWQAFGER